MKKAFLFTTIFGFGLLISSCNGIFGDLFGPSNPNPGDSLYCHHGNHTGNDHDADDSTIVKDTIKKDTVAGIHNNLKKN